ncbi:MAG: hypothetical protein ACKOWF_08240, partial [Chloroflexota bacterium]
MNRHPVVPIHARISRRRVARLIAGGAAAAALPRVFTPAARAEDAVAASVYVPDPVRFPEDSGIHADANTEWWYYT